MKRRWIGVGGMVLGVGLLLATPARALIVRPTPLSDFLEVSEYIFTAKVEEVDAKRPSLVLAVEKQLKGKAPFTRLPILLKGDARAEKLNEVPQLLKRVAPKLPVVVFVSQREKTYQAFAYTNGTWFNVTGVEADGAVRWSFTHLELYLRRTFKGTTAEMVEVVTGVLAGKRKAPPLLSKEKPGLGPEVVPEKKGALRAPLERPSVGVIPTVLVGGPLAMLAMLFPAVFGGWKRWLVLLSVAGTNSTLYTLHYWFADELAGTWWGTPAALWTGMALVTVAGTAWAWRRHLHRVQAGEAPAAPGAVELVVLGAVSLIGLGTLGFCVWRKQSLLTPDWLPLVAFCLAVWAGTGYVAWARLLRGGPAPALATETVILTASLFASTALGAVLPGRGPGGVGAVEGGEQQEVLPPKLLWTFRVPAKGSLSSSPLVAGDRVYVAAALDHPFFPSGAVYCLERETGKVVWTFTDGGKMKQVHSSPCLAGGYIYIGEGFHQDTGCKVYCLSADKGEKRWEFLTGSHTEATPCVVGGKVFCGAGDDGLYCLTAEKGAKVWNFPSFHIDAEATVAGGWVYAGCAVGDAYKETALFCLDEKGARPRWRVSTDLAVWSRPAVSAGRVYFGTGNGRLNEPAEKNPSGAVTCVRAADGKEVWKRKCPDAVLGRVVVDRWRAYFGCRDGHLYCLDRHSGDLVWRRDLGSPVVTTPAVALSAESEVAITPLYAAAQGGRLCCLGPSSGKLFWSVDLAEQAKSAVEVLSSPAVEVRRDAEGRETRRLYVGVTRVSTGRTAELYCLEDRLPPGAAE